MTRMIVAIAALMAMAPLAAQRQDAAETLLQTAIKQEVVDGNLAGAIEGYKKALAAAKSNRVIAAQALVHMAECYRKLGDSQSRKIYEQIVRDYGDQKEAVALARAKLGGAEPQKVITLKQVWSGPKVDVYGSVSPDGRYLSFVDWANHGNLGLHDLTTGADRLIATGGEAEYSTISRDSKMVAFSWYKPDLRRYEIRLASLSGDTKPRTLYDNEEVVDISPYDWSPDGKWVAVALRRKDHTAQLGLVSPHDGSLRVLKSINWSGSTRMFFSPDGRFLAYDLLVGDAADQRDVFVLAADGSREIAAVASPSQDIVMGWSPDGSYLLFASDRTGSMGLWAVPVHDGTPQGQPQLLKANIGPFESSMGVTASGALYFGRTGRSRNIEIVPVNWSQDKFLGPPTNPIQRFMGSNSRPSWSADSRYLSCVSMRLSGAGAILVIVSADTGQIVREVRPRMGFVSEARLAPDGRSFAVLGVDLKGRQGIFRVDGQAGDATPLVMSGEPPAGSPPVTVAAPAWSPDGKSLFFIRGSRDLHGVQSLAFVEKDLTSGEEREIIQGRSLGGMRLSPDGRWIAAPTVDPTTKSAAVLLIPARGGRPRELLRAAAPAQFRIPGWTPDSSLVVWKSLTGDWSKAGASSEVWRVPVDGGEPRRLQLNLASLPAAPRQPGLARPDNLQFSPDGRYIAYDTNSGSLSEVSVLENFLPRVKASKGGN